MPPRGTASLWPIRILTDFGKSAYVLWSLAGLLFVVAIVSPRLRGNFAIPAARTWRRACSFCFSPCWCRFSPAKSSNGSSDAAGRSSVARPIAFNFTHFAGTEAYASFPSGHAITSFALAFAVSAMWPQARAAMIVVCRR